MKTFDFSLPSSALALLVTLGVFLLSFSPLPLQAAPTMKKLPSGLEIQDHKVGDGSEAISGKMVDVHYTGWLKNTDGSKGKEFDSSRKRNQPFSFPLGQGRVIQGWDIGVVGMKEGGKRTLVIPSALAYGERGAGGAIPPGADLIFDVELIKVR